MTERVLVTGGAGYLGSVLVPLLLDEGYEVIVLDRFYFGREPLAPVLDHARLRLVEGDLRYLDAQDGLLDGVHAVVHLASLSNDPACDLKPKRTERINYEATMELARRSARAGVQRFLFASSCSVYGSNPAPIVDEESELHPVSLYAQMKQKAEQGLMLLPAPGMATAAFRMATLYGLSPRMRFDLAINLMVMNAVQKGVIHVTGGGRQWRPFLHVVDAARAYLHALRAPVELIDHQVYNLGSDAQNYQIQQLAEIVRDSLTDLDVKVETVPDDDDRRSYRVTFERSAEVFGYRPQCKVEESIVEIGRAIRSGAMGDCSESRFFTVRHLRECDDTPALEGGDPVREEMLLFAQPLVGREEEREVIDTLRSGWLTTGPKTKKFEEELAEYTGAKHAVCVNSCTAALHLSLAALDIGSGDEVITSPITFPATANVVIHQGATPVFADVDPTTLNIDPREIERKITPRTKAIIPVHMAGHPVDMDAVHAIAREHGLAVIEDAAHAIGAEYKGRRIGNLDGSIAACFSFYPIKNMTSAEGGALLTNDDALADRARLLSLHGISADAWQRYGKNGTQHWETLEAGYKYNMTDLQAAIGRVQLQRLDGFLQTRARYAAMYREALADVPEIEILRSVPDVHHAWHLFVVLLRTDLLSINRDEFVEALRAEKVASGIHFRSLHVQPFYRERFGLRPETLPHAAALSDRLLSLPLYPKMGEVDVQDVIEAVRKLARAYGQAAPARGAAPARELVSTR
ncbi:MAG: aminotransferase class I/II-fold pyridoxal phosphate-dependent enzyme [Dehalococcoidia bacterium]